MGCDVTDRLSTAMMTDSAHPCFTILTASLNAAATIGRTLASVREQRFVSLEHVVVDGASRDGTLDVLREFAGTYPLAWRSEPDGGIADALNKGVRLARGRYILVLQADDRLAAPDVLARVHASIGEGPCDFHVFPVMFEHPRRGEVLLRPRRLLWWNRFKFILCHQGCFTSRGTFARIGGFRTELAITFDYDFFYRALKARCRVRFGGWPVAVMGGGGMSSREEMLGRRLDEERRVQMLNEEHRGWRAAQALFHAAYLPYKRLTHPSLRRGRKRMAEEG
jgi:glycosyltransferase involved in cell wall biosynthesis